MRQQWMWASLFAVSMAAYGSTALAQGAPDVLVTPPAPSPPATSAPTAPDEAGRGKIAKKGKRAGDTASMPSQSNKGGEVRGLDRADQRVGQNGLQGRDTARTRQGR